MQLFHIAFAVARELHRVHAPIARSAFFVRTLHAQLHRPQRPWRRRGAGIWRLRQQFELRHRTRTLTVAGTQAIGAGIAAANDDHVLAGRHNLVGNRIALTNAILLPQKLHGEMDALELASRHVQISRLLGAARQQDCVEFATQVLHRDVAAHMRVGLELHTFRAQLFQAPVDEMLLHLEVRNAVAQQAANTVVLFEDRHFVPRTRQLLCRRQAGRPGPDHRDSLAGADLRGLRTYVAFLECPVDDRLFDLFDRHRRLVDSQHARGFARGRTDAAGEFGKVIGGVQLADGFLPPPAIHQVVPIRNDVGQRASGMAEGHAAIHAARTLQLHTLFRERIINFEPVFDAHRRVAPRRQFPRVFHESGYFTHGSPPRR